MLTSSFESILKYLIKNFYQISLLAFNCAELILQCFGLHLWIIHGYEKKYFANQHPTDYTSENKTCFCLNSQLGHDFNKMNAISAMYFSTKSG